VPGSLEGDDVKTLPLQDRKDRKEFLDIAVETAGYVEGKNLAIKDHFTNFRPELTREAAGDLVRLKVNVIFAIGPDCALRRSRARMGQLDKTVRATMDYYE